MNKFYVPISIMFSGLLVGLSIIYWGHPGTVDSQGGTTASFVDHSSEMPPVTDATGNYPYVNAQRLRTLASQNYKGPSYKETYVDAQRMVAEKAEEAKLAADHRAPAGK